MPATPRGASSTGLIPNKARSMRGGVLVRNGGVAAASGLGKYISLQGVVRSSSTLPRMSAKQLQQPIPQNSPSFLRPNSSANFPSAPIAPVSSLLVSQAQSFQQVLPPFQQQLLSHTHSMLSSSILAPKPCDLDDVYMDELCRSITDHVLPDGKY